MINEKPLKTHLIWWEEFGKDCSLLFISSISESTFNHVQIPCHGSSSYRCSSDTWGTLTGSLIWVMWAGALKLLQGTSDCQRLCQTSCRSACRHQGKHVLCESPQQQKKKKLPRKVKARDWGKQWRVATHSPYEWLDNNKSINFINTQ